jgi:hypothetical protein
MFIVGFDINTNNLYNSFSNNIIAIPTGISSSFNNLFSSGINSSAANNSNNDSISYDAITNLSNSTGVTSTLSKSIICSRSYSSFIKFVIVNIINFCYIPLYTYYFILHHSLILNFLLLFFSICYDYFFIFLNSSVFIFFIFGILGFPRRIFCYYINSIPQYIYYFYYYYSIDLLGIIYFLFCDHRNNFIDSFALIETFISRFLYGIEHRWMDIIYYYYSLGRY